MTPNHWLIHWILHTQILLRHVDWDRESPDFDARVFVLTETIQVRPTTHCTLSILAPPWAADNGASLFFWHQFTCLILILVEVFYIFFASSDLASFLFGEMLLMIEIVAILAGFTVVCGMMWL